MARRTWCAFSKSGYGLKNLAKNFNIQFQHHDAESDARTAGLILIRAMEETGFSPSEWIERCNKTSISSQSASIKREGSDEGSLAGENIVFTESLQISRQNAADRCCQSNRNLPPNGAIVAN